MTAASASEPLPANVLCPLCARPAGRIAPVVTSFFSGAPIGRCLDCGTRYVVREGAARAWGFCDGCGMPSQLPATNAPAESAPSGGASRCPDCRSGGLPEVDPRIAEATESEIRLALREAWRFLGSDSLTPYLHRVARAIAGPLGCGELRVRVALFDQRRVQFLGLPSGTVLLSAGALSVIDDEAELAFVLGRELAHVAAGDSARSLARLGLHAVARHQPAPGPQPWAWAAEDLIKLGHGDACELEADRRALQAVTELEYDPDSVSRHLQRLDTRLRRGEPALHELAGALPPPALRRRELESLLRERPDSGSALRSNRETLRRAVGDLPLSAGLRSVPATEALAMGDPEAAPAPEWRRRFWTVAGIVAVAALILVVGLLLAG